MRRIDKMERRTAQQLSSSASYALGGGGAGSMASRTFTADTLPTSSYTTLQGPAQQPR